MGLDSRTNKMHNMTERFGAHLPASSTRRGKFRRSRSYLAMIACVLQDSPDKMLTVSQLMDRLETLVSGERKCLRNTVTMCLSTNKCFVKIPMDPGKCSLNYWKLDFNLITAKMVRRHFKGSLDQFPELASKVTEEAMVRSSKLFTTLHSLEPATCKAVKTRCGVKFSSPFSIESLLKRDSSSGLESKPSSLSVPVRVEQQPCSTEGGVGIKRRFSWDSPPVETHLQGSGGRYPLYTTWSDTDQGLIGNGSRPTKRMCISTEPSLLIHTRPSSAPYSNSPQSSYINYPVPTYIRDVHHFHL